MQMTGPSTRSRRPLPRRVGVTLAVLLGASLGGSSCNRSPDSGARVAEPQEGAWVWICAAQVEGPERPEKRAAAKATHLQRGQARRLAISAACAKVGGGAPCSAQTAEWRIENETCSSRTGDDSEGGRTTHRCELEVVRPAGLRSHRAQTEGRTADKACERARREACRRVSGGDSCVDGKAPWSVTTTLGRHRPDSP